MKITPGQNQVVPVDLPSPLVTQGTQVKVERVSTPPVPAKTVEKVPSAAGATVAQPINRPTDVTLRRDTNGRVYYVVSDAKSGQEILEVPPKALRDVGQGIEDYLKEAESKASSHLKVKA
jgi:hypothetical protein